VFSPYSVAIALAMTRNGARGRTAEEMDAVLHAPPLDRFNSGLNALTRLVESRAGSVRRADRSKATITLDVANSLWGQHDTSWERPFLDVLKREYGAGLRVVDYRADAEAARRAINAWTADRTADKIPELLASGTLDYLTRLVLVNAIYLKAPWECPFVEGLTRPVPFRVAGGGTVASRGMSGAEGRISYATGPGWRAARLPYAGGHLAMTVVLPDGPSLAALERALDGAGLDRMLAPFPTDPVVDVVLPKWRFRLAAPLNDHLRALGMRDAFDTAADLSAMTTSERLFISLVQHETFIAVDEEGTEAAAATAVVARVTSAGPTPVPFVVDRPFLFLIHDVQSRTPLFLGRVDDPTTE
jgi:serpin B